jgi:hypothetical protein
MYVPVDRYGQFHQIGRRVDPNLNIGFREDCAGRRRGRRSLRDDVVNGGIARVLVALSALDTRRLTKAPSTSAASTPAPRPARTPTSCAHAPRVPAAARADLAGDPDRPRRREA